MSVWCEGRREDWFCTLIQGGGPLEQLQLSHPFFTCLLQPVYAPYAHNPDSESHTTPPPSSLLLEPNQSKVCDFNLSRLVCPPHVLLESKSDPNSPGWQSPEVLSGQPYGKAADVFSFGVVAWEVATLKEPWR